MVVWFALCVFVFVRVVVNCVCALFAICCAMLYGVFFVLHYVFVCLAVFVCCL